MKHECTCTDNMMVTHIGFIDDHLYTYKIISLVICGFICCNSLLSISNYNITFMDIIYVLEIMNYYNFELVQS